MKDKQTPDNREEVQTMKTFNYRVYCGLNDKTTKKQEIPTEEAQNVFNNLVARMFDGATVWMADGVYTHVDGTQVSEKTLCCELVFTDGVKVKKFCNQLKEVFNQESIAVQAIEVEADLW